MKMKIIVTDKIAEEAVKLMEKEGFEVKTDEIDHEKLLVEIPKYDALIVRSRTKVDKDVIKAGADGKLKVIGRAGIGVDNIDLGEAGRNKIMVVNAPTGATFSVAELTIAHMLTLSRRICIADFSKKKGEWIKKQLKGTELHGKTLGLVGCGNIGRCVAKYAKIFNMKIIGYDPFLSKEEMEKNGIEKIEKLEELISESDYISLHIPHTEKTHHIIDAKMISKMKKNAYLINIARGGTVDEKALYEALKKGEIAGAGLDVFEKEPPVNNPLLDLDNVVLTPHIGANTKEGQIRAGTVCAEQVLKALKGEKPDFWVNKKLM